MARDYDDELAIGPKEPPDALPDVLGALAPGQTGLDLSFGPGLSSKIRGTYNLIVVVLACIMMTAITVLMGAEVVFRYVLDSSLIWAEETCRYLLIWTTFLFAGAAFQRGEMIAVEFFIARMNHYVGLLLSLVGYLLVIVLLSFLTYYGYEYASFNDIQSIPAADFVWGNLTGRDANISVFWIYVALPVGCTIMALHFIIAAIDKVARLFGAKAGGQVRGQTAPADRRVGDA